MEAEKPAGKWQRIKYDAAFRVEAIRHVTQDRQVAARVVHERGVARALGVGRASASGPPCGQEALEQENKQLRARLARAEMGRDILKNR